MIKKILIDDIKLTPLRVEDVLSYIIALLGKKDKSCRLTYLNAYIYCLAKRNNRLKDIILDSDIVLADGISIVWAALLINRTLIPRCIMTRVFDEFLISTSVPACNCILIGVTDQEVKKAQEKINQISRNVKIIKAYSGYHTEQFYSNIFKVHHNIDLVLIGMSSPKSEYLCKLAKELCEKSIVWHIGGGTIKLYAETKRRAPTWTSRLGIEWIHRLLIEKHTRKRYLLYNFVFIYFIITGILRSFHRLFIRDN